MKLFLVSCMAAIGAVVCAQTNAPLAKQKAQQIEITSDTGQFDGKAMQMSYIGHVLVFDNNSNKLSCERLTVSLPQNGSHLTNIVAEGNVDIDYLNKGLTNHITANKAVYSYSVVTNQMKIVTNEVVTFAGGQPMPQVENPKFATTGDPLVFDIIAKSFVGMHKTIIHLNSSGGGTNASPFDFLK